MRNTEYNTYTPLEKVSTYMYMYYREMCVLGNTLNWARANYMKK